MNGIQFNCMAERGFMGWSAADIQFLSERCALQCALLGAFKYKHTHLSLPHTHARPCDFLFSSTLLFPPPLTCIYPISCIPLSQIHTIYIRLIGNCVGSWVEQPVYYIYIYIYIYRERERERERERLQMLLDDGSNHAYIYKRIELFRYSYLNCFS